MYIELIPPSIDVNFSLSLAFDSDPGHTFDSDCVLTLVFNFSPVLNFGPDSAFNSDPSPALDSHSESFHMLSVESKESVHTLNKHKGITAHRAERPTSAQERVPTNLG
ncbi:hypothetical protein EVAR_9264_1 [Eumeta japonica]|uniref:Uncharacterized protein n=1 Tax=Eumeta variegata TaxID=151549 RepID=A0A4C1TNU9_EUMVA|nr:hypothetical protein EVAR_9264_1 [Eumeta japonica]